MEYRDPHEQRKVTLPEGESGGWRITRFEVERGCVHTFRLALSGRDIRPGWYTKLANPARSAWMTDTPAEYRDAAGFIHDAAGDVLISGLGLGMVVKALLKKIEVSSVTVLEIEPDVIALVAPHYQDPRLRVIEADAYSWRPDRAFDWAWHDIWGDVSEDDLPSMARICRHYAKHMKGPGRQQVWGRDLVRRGR